MVSPGDLEIGSRVIMMYYVRAGQIGDVPVFLYYLQRDVARVQTCAYALSSTRATEKTKVVECTTYILKSMTTFLPFQQFLQIPEFHNFRNS